jgi:hypothetical protein
MAEYSANLYAKSDEERRSYIEYYKKYYREGGDAAPALAALQVFVRSEHENNISPGQSKWT